MKESLRRFVRFLRSEQWAMTVSIIAAVLLQIPSLIDMINGQIGGVQAWNIAGIVSLLSGLLIRTNTWAQATVERATEEALHAAPDGYKLVKIND